MNSIQIQIFKGVIQYFFNSKVTSTLALIGFFTNPYRKFSRTINPINP